MGLFVLARPRAHLCHQHLGLEGVRGTCKEATLARVIPGPRGCHVPGLWERICGGEEGKSAAVIDRSASQTRDAGVDGCAGPT
eukprot:51240-Eustigmatos_ZCMA.PRE.1